MNFTGRGGGVYGAIISVFVLLVIALIFLLIKVFIECGKHRDRVFIFMVLFFLNITEIIMSFLTGTDTFCILIAVFSFIAAVCNFLGILIPCLNICKHLTVEEEEIPTAPSQPINEMNEPNQNLIEVQPQNETPIKQENYPSSQEVLQEQINDKNDYPVPEEVMQETISKPVTPYVTEKNPGYDNLNNINQTNSFLDAPTPVYQQQNDVNNNNQGYMPYPNDQ